MLLLLLFAIARQPGVAMSRVAGGDFELLQSRERTEAAFSFCVERKTQWAVRRNSRPLRTPCMSVGITLEPAAGGYKIRSRSVAMSHRTSFARSRRRLRQDRRLFRRRRRVDHHTARHEPLASGHARHCARRSIPAADGANAV